MSQLKLIKKKYSIQSLYLVQSQRHNLGEIECRKYSVHPLFTAKTNFDTGANETVSLGDREMNEIDELKRIDIKMYVKEHYMLDVNKNGMAHCPFHPPDKNPSLQFWEGRGGVHRFTDYHGGKRGTLIDFVMKMENCTMKDAVQKIKATTGAVGESERVQPSPEYYIYKDLEGHPVFRKGKRLDNHGKKTFWTEHDSNGKWAKKKGGRDWLPYNLPDLKHNKRAIVCEGEKDADTVKAVVDELKLGYWVTSAPTGKAGWPSSITKYFEQMEEVMFIYDVGSEKDAKSHAAKLLAAHPHIDVQIGKVPLDEEGKDISDYLDQALDRCRALLDIQGKAERLQTPKRETDVAIETSEDLLKKLIPPIERLIDPFLERNGFTLVGGSKGIGKSLLVTQMALHYASGNSGFLNCEIEKPGRVLLIQQEVGEAGMQDRLIKMYAEGDFDTQGRFFTKTTTGNQWDLTKKTDKQRISDLVLKTHADLLILDPLYTFFPGELNSARDMARVISVLMEVKTKYNLSLVVVHHFTNKSHPDEIKQSTGRFMGHSNLANAADVTVAIEFLHPKYKGRALRLPYNHYAALETTTRHGEWPEPVHIERRQDQLMFHVSSIWDEIGKKVPPDEVVAFVKACGGEKALQDVISYFEETKSAHENTIRKSINEAIELGKLGKETMTGQHGRKILRIPMSASSREGCIPC